MPLLQPFFIASFAALIFCSSSLVAKKERPLNRNQIVDRACFIMFDTLNAQVEGRLLTDAEETEIARLFETQDPDAPEKAFKIYKEARLRALPPEIVEEVRAVVASASVSMAIRSSDFGGEYRLAKNSITLEMPPRFLESLVHYEILAHEMEHAIQAIRTKHGLGRNNVLWAQYRNVTRFKKAEEEGAMLSEANFILSIPYEHRAKLVAAIQAAPNILPYWKHYFARTLGSQAPSPKAYVANEHREGRYNTFNILRSYTLPEYRTRVPAYARKLRDNLKHPSVRAVAASLLAVTAALSGYKYAGSAVVEQACDELDAAQTVEPKGSPLYRVLCRFSDTLRK